MGGNEANLHAGREADQVGADTEAGTLAGSHADTGRHNIQDGKHSGSDHGQGQDLIHRQGTLGHKDGGDGHKQTLNQILDSTVNNLGGEVHGCLYSFKIFFLPHQRVLFKQIQQYNQTDVKRRSRGFFE